MVKVLIAEDNIPISVSLSNAINSTKDVQAVSIINEGTKVYQKIKMLKPQILLLDLKLPGMDGLQILDMISNDDELREMKIIIYSGEPEYMSKVIGYDNVIRFFDKVRMSIQDVSIEIENIAKEIENKRLNEQIMEKLVKIGFQTKFEGTKLLRDCIVFSINTKNENMEEVYIEIARIKQKNERTIKANIRDAIKVMWRKANKEQVRKYLRLGEEDSPSNKDVATMIKYYVERV